MYNDLIELLAEGRAGEHIVDPLPIAIYATDVKGRLKYFNAAAATLSGREPELDSDKWCVTWKLYHPDGTPMPHEECPMAVALKEGRMIEGQEAIAERPGGERIWIRAYSLPLKNKKGKVIGGINFLVNITDQKESETKLRKSQEELADFFENAAVGLHLTRADGTVKRANQAILNMLGYTRDEFVGHHIRDFHADQELVEDIMQKLATGEELHNLEVRLRHKDGSIRHALVSSSGYREDGEFVHTRCVTRDVTSRKQTEAELADLTIRSERMERLYEAVISATPDLVYVFDLNYRFIFANDALLEMWGCTKEEYMGKSLLEIGYEPWHAEMHEREIDKVIATKQPVRGDVSFPHAILGERMYDYIFVPVLNEKGEVEAVAGTTRDVTERKQAEQALRTSEEKYRTLFEEMNEGFCILKMKFDDEEKPVGFTFLETNPVFTEQTGLKDVEGNSVSEVLPELAEFWFKELGSVALTGEPVHVEDYVERLQRWFEISAFQIGEPQERKVAVLISNITRRKHALEELKALNETLEERVEERTEALLSYQARLRSLASQLGRAEENQRHQLAAELHDNLGQLLAIGKMKIDMLHRNPDADYSSRLVSELKEVMDDAIAYTRGLMNDLKPPPSLNNDLRSGLDWVAERLERRGLKVTIQEDGQPGTLKKEAKATIIRSVKELLFNVLKHTSEDEASVLLKKTNGRLKISVKDGGEGFDMNSWEWLSDENGGYGLFNIREQLNLLGGDLEIQSKPGKGTTVTLLVPVKEKEAPADVSETDKDNVGTSEAGPTEIVKVLLVDDHRMIREGLRKIIEEQDDIVVIGEAADGEEAVKLTAEISPDVILMDINLPDIDGIEATRRIMVDRPGVRIIGLSLHNEERVVKEMRNAGASAYLTKTEAFESLAETIRAEASTLRK